MVQRMFKIVVVYFKVKLHSIWDQQHSTDYCLLS